MGGRDAPEPYITQFQADELTSGRTPAGPLDPLATFRLDDRVAIVTGGSSGLGARFAEVLAAAGARVALVARRADRLAEVAERIDGSLVIAADVSVRADVERLTEEVVERFGRVDVLVNNAGISDVIPAEDEEIDQFAGVIAVNLTAAYHLAQVVGRRMLAQGSGSIINVASVLAFRSAGQIPQAGYAASKGGLLNLSKELAAQWSRRGVRVNALCPGWFYSEMTDDLFSTDEGKKWLKRNTVVGRPGHPHELDGALIFLASDASSYVTGTSVVVDGGFLAM